MFNAAMVLPSICFNGTRDRPKTDFDLLIDYCVAILAHLEDCSAQLDLVDDGGSL